MAVGTDGRTRRAFAAALAAHACALFAMSVLPGILRPVPFAAVDDPPIDVSVDEIEPPEPAPPPVRPAAAVEPSVPPAPRSDPLPHAMPSPAETYLHGDAGSLAPLPGSPERADGWSEPVEPSEPGLLLPLGLSWDALAEAAPPAPTAPPRAPVVSRDAANHALTSVLRHQDKQLGLGNPEETIVGTAVSTAGRALAVPKDTRFRIEVSLDREGHVLGVEVPRASSGDVGTWKGLATAVKGALGDAIQIGPDVRRAGGRVVIDATVMHVFVSGNDEAVTYGACPTDPHTSGMWDAVPFGWVGGTMYGQPPTGECALSDATNGQPKQIQVRMKTTTVLPGAVPQPAATFGSAKKPTRMPTIWDAVNYAIGEIANAASD